MAVKRLVVSVRELQTILERRYNYKRSIQTLNYHLRVMGKYRYHIAAISVVNKSDIPKIYKELKKKKVTWR